MHFFRDKALAERFRDGTVPSRERLYYFLLVSIVTSVIMSPSLVVSAYEDGINSYDAIGDIITVFITLIGLNLLYRTNARGDDKEFIERVTCLTVPVIVKMSLYIAIPAVVFYGLLTWQLGESVLDASTPYDVASEVIISVILYLRLNSCIRIAASAKKE